ncbi:hypothetical protein FH972_026565 [Carpinus fangiana]|uniref:Protein kinase domain-containing protein n=1 Tax=Carpinus fangiana TaxID=176857 RepID=A0A5N6L4D1_9ROSI|nr:hypothetical protein FH972_026565 [Carpinus fangiana]
MAVASPQAGASSATYATDAWSAQQAQDASPKRRQDFSRENTDDNFEYKLGDYILGQTLGAGEFGKVRLGWKKPSASSGTPAAPQVAIKMIKRRKLDTTSRVGKVYREINILRELEHPNIVRLHEMVETDDTIGIILEYASGGELFDYILHHRYLKDPSARRLFAQLISGVGYLHKKGIIHRDLKLENLLLDRNKNIIITDFGFANQFDPLDMLPDNIEKNLHKRDWVQANNLDKPGKNGWRRGDLMATSCGSPCYAAPELVVSDGLYHGRKVDVWSCGVILYAMLAGYLPFDDDPKNPDGDNINALYQYITNTELIFPDYVTPHARDLLRRILVPDPRKRADLFEVARHSWLSEFSNQLESVTSTVDTAPISSIKPPISIDGQSPPSLARSASVREPSKPNSSPSGTVPSFPSRTAAAAEDVMSKASPTSRDAKRRTVQLEYVPPQNHTQRSPRDNPYQYGSSSMNSSTRPRTQENGSREVRPHPPPKDEPPGIKGKAPPPVRPARDYPRSTSDSTAFTSGQYPSRPATQGSMTGSRLPPSRGSYGQPSSATITTTNAHGQVSMPKSAGQQNGTSAVGSGLGPRKQINSASHPSRGHKRSSTLGGLGDKLLGRSSSVSKRENTRPSKTDRTYPPTSMKPMAYNEQGSNEGYQPRASVDSKRSGAFGKKSSFDAGSDQYPQSTRTSRRFSWFEKLRPRSSRDTGNWGREENASRDTNYAPTQAWQQTSTSTNATQSTQTGTTRNPIRRSISRIRDSLDGGSRGPLGTSTQQAAPQEEQFGFKPHRRFDEEYSNSKKQQTSAGSSGAARRVMDYFRRRKQPSTQPEYWDNDG